VPEHDLAPSVAYAEVDVVRLSVRIALRHVAVEVVEAAGELARAALVAPQEREREVRREHRHDLARPLVQRSEVDGEEGRRARRDSVARAHSFLNASDPPRMMATITPAVVTPTMMIEITAVSG
jgi:hypothetical protein